MLKEFLRAQRKARMWGEHNEKPLWLGYNLGHIVPKGRPFLVLEVLGNQEDELDVMTVLTLFEGKLGWLYVMKCDMVKISHV